MAAMLTAETGSTEKVVKYLAEARGMGLTVLPPDVHESSLYFTPVGDKIRFGLAAIKNVGENTARGICEARRERARFADLFDFCERLDAGLLNRRVLESLVKSGALDSLGSTRSSLWAEIDEALKEAQRLQRERSTGQNAFFATTPVSAPARERRHADVEDWSEDERLAGEYAMLGFYISGHPLDKYAGRLKEMSVVEIGSIEGRKNGAEITVAGVIAGSRPMRSKRGARWAILNLQDQSGGIEALIFPEAFERLEPVLKGSQPLVVRGRVSVEEVGTRLAVSDAKPLEQMLQQRSPGQMRVRVDLSATDAEMLEELYQLIASRPGRCKVTFDLLGGDGTEATLEAASGVQADPELLERIRGLCGPDAVLMQ